MEELISGRNTAPIEISQREAVDGLRRRFSHTLSSHAFASLYLWRRNMKLGIYLTDNLFSVKCGIKGENAWFFPCGEEEAVYDFIKSGMSEKSFKLVYMRNRDAEWLERNFPGKWRIERNIDDDEYICDRMEYINAEGSKYSRARQKMNKLAREHTLKTEIISGDNLSAAFVVEREWERTSLSISPDTLTEQGVFAETFENARELRISGAVTYIDNIPSAVFAGFMLDDETLDIAIGKTLRSAPQGLVYYAMREYLKRYGENVKYCNLEEDLGISGMRSFKERLRPVGKNEISEAELL